MVITIAAVGIGLSTYFESSLWFWVCIAVCALLTLIAIFEGSEFWFYYGFCGAVLFVMSFLTGAFPGVSENLTGALMTGAGVMVPSCFGHVLRKLGSEQDL